MTDFAQAALPPPSSDPSVLTPRSDPHTAIRAALEGALLTNTEHRRPSTEAALAALDALVAERDDNAQQAEDAMHAMEFEHLRAAAAEARVTHLEGERPGVAVMLDAIADFFADVPEAIKVMKVGEENGEAVEAYIGLIGANVRKGKTHEPQDVVKELADVAITAYVALSAFSGDPFEAIETRAARILDRLGVVADGGGGRDE